MFSSTPLCIDRRVLFQADGYFVSKAPTSVASSSNVSKDLNYSAFHDSISTFFSRHRPAVERMYVPPREVDRLVGSAGYYYSW